MQDNQIESEGPLEAPATSLSQSCTLEQLREILPHGNDNSSTSHCLPETTPSRQRASLSAQSLDQDEYLPSKVSRPHDNETGSALSPEKTVLYLAYGSNLSSETFLGVRGIKPLSQLNVTVPELRLTFDLPGLPYVEPCFAGTRFHDPCENEDELNRESAELDDNDTIISEKRSLLQYHSQDLDRDQRYNGPLVGVVYEVTLTDYATIIATEGGGRGYKDIVVDCYPFPKSYDPADPIPEHPDTQPIKAHTLLSPAALKDQRRRRSTRPGSPNVRPNPCYAQPSARYLKLITTGAAEHNLPLSYQAHLARIQPYRITSTRQRIGKPIFLIIWGPLLLLILSLSKLFAGPDGRSPRWLVWFADLVLSAMWSFYDNFFVHIFGDGERTVEG